MSKKNYYSILGVKKDAKADELKKAYRRLARKYHPDVNPNDKSAEEKFKEVQEAYDILSDPNKRKVFDRFGYYSDNLDPNSPFNGGGAPGTQGGPSPFDFSGFQREGGGMSGSGVWGFRFFDVPSASFVHRGCRPLGWQHPPGCTRDAGQIYGWI